MFKSSVKPVWCGLFALLVTLGVAIRLAFALGYFTPSAAPIGYVAQDDVTNFNLKSGNEAVFRPNYEREFWSGNLFAYKSDAEGNLPLGVNNSYWDNGSAAEQLDLQNIDTGRRIATMKDDGSKIAFRWGNLSAGQQTYLASPVAGEPEAILQFLRGDRGNEIPNSGKTLRRRASRMGDIIHSRPFYVADASAATPAATVFVGANDGMLHAIDATQVTGGQERWAYIPSMLLSKMKNLSVAADPVVHDYYVDGQINITTISDARRVLVGGLGAGGRGLYALDISDMTAADEAAVASKVMWEITPTKISYATPASPNENGYVNLGFTYGTMTMAKVAGVDAVIVGNGFNDGRGGYGDCTHATPTYQNCGGNYAAYLYVINTATGQLISKIKAGPDGTAGSPNGLSTPTAVDTDGDGSVDTVFAGDLNGTMWRFNLAAGTASALMTTDPGSNGLPEAITVRPAVAKHPNGGYMVNFASGKMLVDADSTDTSVHYAYGVWDAAPVTNTSMLPQTLTERAYVSGGVTTRVRSVTSNPPTWTSGGNKGWKVALPAGERVLGEGSFIENERFYFTGYNPTILNDIPGTDDGTGRPIKIAGENWQMELDYLSGGSKNKVFLDLNGSAHIEDDLDRIVYIAGDTLPVTTPATLVGSPIKTTDGIAVGKFISVGLMSQPILIQLTTLNDTLYNQNPDIVVPASPVDRGVANGHFDVEFYYAAPATAIITVSTTGQTTGFPATLGAITINGITVVPALTVADIPNAKGSFTNTNAIAEMIRRKVTGGFTATRSGARVILRAPTGDSYNGMSLDIADGTSQTIVQPVTGVTAVTAVAPSPGRVVITDVGQNQSISLKCGSAFVGSSAAFTSLNNATASLRLDALFTRINGTTFNGYSLLCVKADIPTNTLTCAISAPAAVSACSGGFTVDSDIVTSNNTGPQGGVTGVVGVTAVAKSGFSNFKPALLATVFTGGSPGDTCNNGAASCNFKTHTHEYDDLYNRTGINGIDPSEAIQNLALAIPSTSTKFKVLLQNQYLSPAAKLHIGVTNPAYAFDLDFGYIPVRNYQTSATFDIAAEKTYTRGPSVAGVSENIGALTLNLPVDAFSPKNWWAGVNGLPADVRVGLHPSEPRCVYTSNFVLPDNTKVNASGNMYQPVIPSASVTADGNGTAGYSAATTQLTATGVRHNGALTLQVIDANTPNSEIEISVPGRPEYGYRVKSAFFANRVLAEYTMFFHTKHLNVCYGETNAPANPGVPGDPYRPAIPAPSPAKPWSKLPAPDKRDCVPSPNASQTDTQSFRNCNVPQPADIGTDPRIGQLGAGGGTITDVKVESVDNVTTTTITFSNGLSATIVRTVNKSDGSIEIVTTDTSGGPPTRRIIGNAMGNIKKGGNERGLTAKNVRISWRELLAP